jgi:membrane-bound lytic murein transglycosylase D
MHRLPSALALTLAGMIVCLWSTLSFASDAPLPHYKVIEPNVAFWIDIYSKYTTRQAVIHDSRDLGVVYDVIAVKPYDAPGARKINRDRMKRAKAKYEAILQRLAANPRCGDEDCQRIAQLFGDRADAGTFRRASRQVRSQLGQKDRFQEGVIRSGAYLDEIRAILKAYGVPEDLAYLPHVESSFNPGAYSKFGAAGIWQFTRSTGRRYMSVDYVLDERRDPIRATHAAALLLKDNYAKLGSWPLAITAYNHGAAGMARAREKHGDYPAIFASYSSRTFKFASRNFYSEFLAARQVASDHETYFGPLTLDTPRPSHTVTLKGFVRFEDLCAHYDVVPDVLREMNPALRPPVFSDQKFVPQGYQLRLPYEIAARPADLAAIPASLMKSAQRPSRFYTVQRGDTAGQIARRHGVGLADLILANNLNQRATIYPRQTLRIPLPGEKVAPAEPQVPVIVAKEAPVMVAALEKETPVAAAPPASGRPETDALEPEDSASESDQLSVPSASSPVSMAPQESEGDTVASAPDDEQQAPAAMTASSDETEEAAEMEALAETESPESETIEETLVAQPSEAEEAPGGPEASVNGEEVAPEAAIDAPPETIAVQAPQPSSATVSEAAPERQVALINVSAKPATTQDIPTTVTPNTEIVSIDVRFETMTKVNQRPVGVMRVEVEETLGHYAEWAGVRTQQIRRLNGLRYGRTLHLGQKVKIPLDKIDASAFEEQRYEYHKRLQEDFFAVYRVSELEPYRVQRGDNIWTLCREKFGVPMWLLKHYNMDVDLADLHIQDKIMIPVILDTTTGEPGTVTNDTNPEEDTGEPSGDDPA